MGPRARFPRRRSTARAAGVGGGGVLAAVLGSAALLTACSAAPPQQPERARLLAEAELAAGRPEEAARRFRARLREDPEDARALDGWARSELAAGRPETALEALDRLDALQGPPAPGPVDRTHCRTWSEVLALRAEADRLDEALALAARLEAGRCDPAATARGRGRAFQVRGDAARSGGRAAEALEAYASAASALGSSTPVDVFRRRGDLLLAEDRFEDAVDWLGRGLELYPRDRRLLAMMVEALTGGLGPQ